LVSLIIERVEYMIFGLIRKKYRGRHSGDRRRVEDPLERQVSDSCLPLFALCEHLVRHRSGQSETYPSLLIQLHTESTTVEELVDNFGAQNSNKWYPFREAIAAIKLFSSVCYNVLHIQEALPRYRLIEVKGAFYDDTGKAIAELMDAVVGAARTLILQAKRCGVFHVDENSKVDFDIATQQTLRFPADRNARHVRKTGKTVVYLSTAFLILSKDRDVADVLMERDTTNYSRCIPEAVNEENIRLAEARFHNLQSHYDTYIFESDIESQNRNLPILRGHISVIYHLLQVATELAHYYERHMSEMRRRMVRESRFPLPVPVLLRILFEYLLGYSKRHMDSANNLCRTMIQSYSEKSEIEVPIPNYRGFHVRPSTLIAKIVSHYGSSVTMVIDDQEYNAGITFDLFRANEKINALKRRHICEIVETRMDPKRQIEEDLGERKKEMQMLFLELANDHKIILYDTTLPFDELAPSDDDTMIGLVSMYIRHYMSISKIDVENDLTAVFQGDNRALIDIKLLAETGYGEDKFGNNIVLSPELSYLRR
jgi:hypothetical protein